MNNDDITVENLENLTPEELELALNNDNEDDSNPTDWKAKAEQAEAEAKHASNKAAMLQRLLNKKDKTITKETITTNTDLEKDMAEFRFDKKVMRFSKENNISVEIAERLLTMNPNATADILNDKFIKAGIEEMQREERVSKATPGSKSTASTSSKAYSQMSADEKKAWYAAN